MCFGAPACGDNQMQRRHLRTLDELMDKPASFVLHGLPRALRKKALLALK